MRSVVATAMLLALLVVPAVALADGDPASDVLLLQNAYYPYSPAVPKPVATALDNTLAKAKKAGYPLRVAIIASQNDLGSVPQFFQRPQPYATFLESEIKFNTAKPLLVVMPNGYGVAEAGPTAAQTVAKLKPPTAVTGDALGRAAIDGSLALAKAEGHPLPKPVLPKAAGSGGGSTSPVIIFGVPVVLLALGGLLATLRSRQSDEANVQ
jgi:hypothetical protein